MKRRYPPVKSGAGKLNRNSQGQVTSQTQKAGNTTYTTYTDGRKKVTKNLGGGYFDVQTSRPTRLPAQGKTISEILARGVIEFIRSIFGLR